MAFYPLLFSFAFSSQFILLLYILLVFVTSRNLPFSFFNLTDDCSGSDPYNGGKQVKFTCLTVYMCHFCIIFKCGVSQYT